jgi:hypothetical protein
MQDEAAAIEGGAQSVWMLRCELCGQHDRRSLWADPDEADSHEVACEACGSSVFSLVEEWPA